MRSTVQYAFITLLLLCASDLLAQSSPILRSGKVTDVQLAIWTLPSRDEIARVPRGGEFSVDAGEERMLRVFSPRGSNSTGQRAYLSARLSMVNDSREVALSDFDLQRGTAILKVASYADRQKVTIRYELGSSYDARGISQGTFTVWANGDPSSPAPPGDGPHDGPHDDGPHDDGPHDTPPDLAGEVTRLYRGILMRDPLQNESYEIERVQRDGHPALVDLAQRLADSYESQTSMPQRGITSQQRLTSLMRELFPHRQERNEGPLWQAQKRRLDQGRVVDVVVDLVQSAAYVRDFGRRTDDYPDDRIDLAKALAESAKSFLGEDYRVDPLGEGPDGLVDRDPRLTEGSFDSFTLIQTALAKSIIETSSSRTSGQQAATRNLLDQIRYAEGEVSFATRHHFFVADWVPANSEWVRDVTREIGRTQAQSVTREIQRELFYEYHGLWTSTIQNSNQSSDQKALNWHDARHTAWYFPSSISESLLTRFQEGMIRVFLGYEKGIFARHAGIVTRGDSGRLRMIHADPQSGRVVEVNLRDLLRKHEDHYLGLQVLKVGAFKVPPKY